MNSKFIYLQECNIYICKNPSGMDGGPQRIENSPFGVKLKDMKICNTHFWNFNNFGKNWSFENRNGVIASFDQKGKTRMTI